MTLREAHIGATLRLAARAELREEASRDAASLLVHVLNLPRTALHAHPEKLLTAQETGQMDVLVARRLNHEPMQYILREQEFYGLRMRVTPATLIPRPETELLVEAVLARFSPESAARIVDVGTGSGAIAVALACHRPQAHVVAVDLSAAALEVAEGNARLHGLADRIVFLESDLLAGVPRGSRPDAIVSNPPYIPEGDGPKLHAQVREHEPAMALFAGADGLEVYRRLIPQAWGALGVGGLLAMEIGFGQKDAVAGLLEGWRAVEFLDDLQGIPRVALARRG